MSPQVSGIASETTYSYPLLNLRFRLTGVLREHQTLLILSAAYMAGVAIFMFAMGLQDRWEIRWMYPSFGALFLVSSAIGLSLQPSLRTFESVAGAVLVALIAPPIQSTFNSVKQVIDDVSGYTWDARFAELDRWVHFGRHPWQWLASLVHDRGIIRFVDLGYILWFPVVFGFLLWLAWTTNRANRQKALVAILLVWVLCGNVAALLFASAGPCYYAAVVHGEDPYGPLMAALQARHAQDFLSARFNQIALWGALQSGAWLPFGGISAMPSVHVAMATLIAIVAQAQNRTAGFLLTLFAGLMMVASVVLGWHYAIDGYVGIVMAYAIWRIVPSRIPG